MRTVLNIVYQSERCFCLPCTTIAPPLADQYCPLSDHCGDYCASIRRPRQPLNHHCNGSASILPPLYDLMGHYSNFCGSRNAQGLCCSSYTEAEISGFGLPLSILVNFLVAQKWQKGCRPVLRWLYCFQDVHSLNSYQHRSSRGLSTQKAQSCSEQWKLHPKQTTSPWSQAREQLPSTWEAWLLCHTSWQFRCAVNELVV